MRVWTGRWHPTLGWVPPLPEPACNEVSAAADAGAAEPGTEQAGTHDAPGLVLAFVDPALADTPPLAELAAAWPDLPVVGVSTAGQISRDGVSDGDVVAIALRFHHAAARVVWLPCPEGTTSTSVGMALGRRLSGVSHPAAVLLLSDGLVVNGSELVTGLRALLADGTPVVGGLAGDGSRFRRTWLWCEGGARRPAVAAVALSGPLDVGLGSAGGWDGFGPQRRVTRSRGNVLYEIDGVPALSLYREYLGDLADDLPASALLFPLAITSGSGDELVRTVLGVDPDAQTMTFAGDVPEGASVRLMRTTLERLLDGAQAAATAAVAGSGPPDVAVAVSCVGRRLVLGERTDEEIETVVEALGPGTPLVGFYAYGEIGPHGDGCALHNQTMTLLTLRERS